MKSMIAFAPLGPGVRRHRLRNRLHAFLLLAGMAALLAFCGWSLDGVRGIASAVGAGVISLKIGRAHV